MPELTLWTWLVGVAALIIGILAGHFGWGRRWPRSTSTLHPDYIAGLDYLVTEQPDRALDVFLRLMDADADTVETHFSLGSLYRRRGEVERTRANSPAQSDEARNGFDVPFCRHLCRPSWLVWRMATARGTRRAASPSSSRRAPMPMAIRAAR